VTDYITSFFPFRRLPVSSRVTVTICLFCKQPLAYSARPECLDVVERVHNCRQMREFLAEKR
jgi:hypothetical protein